MNYDDLCWITVLVIAMVFVRAYVLQHDGKAEGFRGKGGDHERTERAATAPTVVPQPPREEAHWLFA